MTVLPLIAATLFAPIATTESANSPTCPTAQTLLTTDYAVEPLLPTTRLEDVGEHDSSGFYLRATGGFVTTSNSDGPGEEIDFDEGYLLSLGLGQRFGAQENGLGFALELDGIWTDSDVSDTGTLQAISDVSVAGALINGIVDFRLGDRLSIYGGAGIGMAWLDIGTTSDSVNDFDDEDGPFLAWQLRAGLAWSFTESLSIHAGYRFLNIDDAQIDDGIGDSSFDLETEQHSLEVGLLFGF